MEENENITQIFVLNFYTCQTEIKNSLQVKGQIYNIFYSNETTYRWSLLDYELDFLCTQLRYILQVP